MLVSHLPGEVEPLCDRLAVIVNGRIAFCGPPARLTQNGNAKTPKTLEQGLRKLYADSAGPDVATAS